MNSGLDAPLSFVPELPPIAKSHSAPWKILVVDDNPEVGTITKLALEGMTFEGRPLEVIQAESSLQARALLDVHADVAVALIDVVMETQNAGLELVRYIRETLGNALVRLIVRTGQPGDFPPMAVTNEYEINDYWEKTEVTVTKMQMSITTSLRGYRDLWLLHSRSVQLRHWADRFPDLLGVRDWSSLIRLTLMRLRELFPENVLSAFLCRNEGAKWPHVGGSGRFPSEAAPDILQFLNGSESQVLLDAWDRKAFSQSDVAQALYFETVAGERYVFYLELPNGWGDYEKNISRLVMQNFRTVLENRSLILDLERHRKELDVALQNTEEILRTIHRRVNASVQTVTSIIDLEASSSRRPAPSVLLRQARKRVEAVGLIHELFSMGRNVSHLDLHTYFKALYESEKRDEGDGKLTIEYWGESVHVHLDRAVALGLIFEEYVNVARDWVRRTQTPCRASIQLTDSPLRVGVRFSPMSADLTWTKDDYAPVPISLLNVLADQVGATFTISTPPGKTDTVAFEVEIVPVRRSS